MTDFHAASTVTGRKDHKCEQCRKPITVGTQHLKVAQVWEGDFHAYREHFECHKAWDSLNFSRDMRAIPSFEGAPFLCNDDHEPEDRDWMREEFPIVAERLGWSK